MNRWKIIIIFCFIFSLGTDISHAAGMLMRVQQMKQQRQGQMTPEQARQYQEYQEQQQGDNAQQPAQPAQPTYQQLVDQRNQAIAQAIVSAHNPAIGNESQSTAGSIQPTQQADSSGPVLPPAIVAGSMNVKDVVDLSEVWKKLDTKSTVWPLLIDDQAKLMTVSEYIDRFQKEGVKINQSPMHYVQMIDQITTQNPEMLQRPFGELLQILAIIDYDFNNGMDKDTLAKKVLGEAGYESNKKRFTQQQQPQQSQQ